MTAEKKAVCNCLISLTYIYNMKFSAVTLSIALFAIATYATGDQIPECAVGLIGRCYGQIAKVVGAMPGIGHALSGQ